MTRFNRTKVFKIRNTEKMAFIRMKKHGLKFLLSILLLGLAACSIPKESFDCPPGKGVGCRSITQVNEQVNEGRLSNAKESKKNTKSIPISQNDYVTPQDSLLSDNLNVQRIPEQHLRIWFAPYQDEQGHFHEDSIIHAVLRPGFWQVQ